MIFAFWLRKNNYPLMYFCFKQTHYKYKIKSSSHHIEVMCKYICGCMHVVGWIRSGWELFFITRNHRLHKLACLLLRINVYFINGSN